MPIAVRLMPVLDFGGVESRIIVQASMSEARKNYRLRVCTFTGAGAAADRIRAMGVPVDVLDTPASLKNPYATAALVRYIRRIKPDLVHSSIVEANVHLCAASAITRVPAIVEEVGQPSHSLKARLLFRILYRVPKRIIAVSKVTRDYLIEADGASRRKVQLIYNCAHPDFFPIQRASTMRPKRERTRFVAIGRFHAIKNHESLLRAFAQLIKSKLNVELRLVGDGPLRQLLQELTADLGIGPFVRFDGFRADIATILAEADAFVLPSLSEGCSISLIESMASGLPAMGSDVAGIREVLGEQLANRWTFPVSNFEKMADTLASFVGTSAAERDTHAAEQQARAYDAFSPRVYLAHLDELYRYVLEGRFS